MRRVLVCVALTVMVSLASISAAIPAGSAPGSSSVLPLWAPTAAASSPGAASWTPNDSPIDSPTTPSGEPSKGATETTVAIDPQNPDVAIVSAIDFNYAPPGWACCARGAWSNAIYTTADGGETWTSRGYVPSVQPESCTIPVAADPALAFDASGTAYLSYISYCEGGTGSAALAVISSRDGGATWSPPAVVSQSSRVGSNCSSLDKPYIGTDPRPLTSASYVAWLRIEYDCDTGSLQGVFIDISASLDDGATWTSPTPVSGAPHVWMQGAMPRVGPDGAIYVSYYQDAPLDLRCPSPTNLIAGQSLESLASTEMVVARSSDGGATWTQTRVTAICDNQFANPEQPLSLGNALSIPSLSIDRGTGTLYLAWSNRDLPSATIHVATSTDSGDTWRIASVGDVGWSAFMPWIVADSGVARMVYVAENSASLYNVIYRESFDGGSSWSDGFRLNTAPLVAGFGIANGPYSNGTFIGHYMGFDAAGGRIIPAWPDNRDATGVQSIYTRPGTYELDGLPPTLDLEVTPTEIEGNGPVDIAATVTDSDGMDTVTSISLRVTDARGRSLGSWDHDSFSRQEDSFRLVIDDFKLSGPSPWTVTLTAEDVDGLLSTATQEVRRGTREGNAPSASAAEFSSEGIACAACTGFSVSEEIPLTKLKARNPIRVLASEQGSSLLSLTRSRDGLSARVKSKWGVMETFRSSRRVLAHSDFKLAFVDYEGFEAELFAIREHAIVVVRILDARRGSSVLVTVHS